MERFELFITNVGSHLWHMETPTSDVDLFVVYAAPSSALLLGTHPKSYVEKEDKEGGFDKAIHEIGHVVHQLLKNNVNFLIGVFSWKVVKDWDELPRLRELAKMNLSKKCYHSIKGMAISNYRKYLTRKDVTEKKLNTIGRILKFGETLLTTGNVVFEPVSGVTNDKIKGMIARLDELYETSPLPENPQAEPQLLSWLLKLRVNKMLDEMKTWTKKPYWRDLEIGRV